MSHPDQPPPAPAAFRPVRERNRIDVIDVLRGFAILGILLVNMASFSLTFEASQGGVHAWDGFLDRATVIAIQFFAQAKFYTLFSFLFGWGMAIQMERAAARSANFRAFFLRRLTILVLIGVTHAVFIWSGDILLTYALIGFALLALRNRSDRTLITLVVLCFAWIFFISAPGPGEAVREAWNNLVEPIRNSGLTHGGNPDVVYKSGSYAEAVIRRFNDLKIGYLGVIYWGPHILGVFVIGLLVGRKRIFQDLPQHLPQFRRSIWWALGFGLIFNLTWVTISANPDAVPDAWFQVFRRGFRAVGGVSLSVFYVCAITLLFQNPTWRERLSTIAPIGRMALSNYLLQSLLGTLIFYGYGLGLYGEFGPFAGLIFTLAIFLFQRSLSAWWLERHDFGPAERFWRWLSYKTARPQTEKNADDTEKHQPSPPVFPSVRGGIRPRALLRRLVAVTPAWAFMLIWAAALAGLWFNLNDSPVTVPNIVERVVATPTPRSPATSTPLPTPTPIATPAVEPVVRAPQPAAANGDLWSLAMAFDAEQAFDEIEILAAPRFDGRLAGSPGGRAAADLIAQRFAAYDLRPAGDDGGYFQTFPLSVTTLTETPELVIESANGVARSYEFRRDFSQIVRNYTGGGEAEGPVVWAQNCTHDEFDGLDAVDAIVLCRSGGDEDAGRNAVEHGAAGLLLIAAEDRPLDRIGPNRATLIPEPIPALTISAAVATDLLDGSGYSYDDLSIHYASFPLATSARIATALTTDENAEGRNVLGVLPGRDPAHAHEIIVLGGHYDHMGADPDGTIWPGANDNASGIAVMFEIARTWQEQGFVPRRTVLFAAWDAEELGLLGAEHYVRNPKYPLDDTVAMLQLDMVGAGDDTLYIDGPGPLADEIAAIAAAVGTSTGSSNGGRSDHTPFRAVGVDASLMIWFGPDASAVPHYHRPADTPAVIEPDKLTAAGRIAGLMLLAQAEGELAIYDFLQARDEHLLAADRSAFMQTVSPAARAAQGRWFDDAVALNPTAAETTPAELLIAGDVVTATLRAQITHAREDETLTTRLVSQVARFRHGAAGWQWDGPPLVLTQTDSDALAVALPPDRADAVPGLSQVAAARYATVAAKLGLPASTDSTLQLFADGNDLRGDTSPTMASAAEGWVGPETLKLVYSPTISETAVFSTTLAQLVLANAGMEERDAPWLWNGLPLLLETEANARAQSSHIRTLSTILAEEDVAVPGRAGTWAAVEHLQTQVGWRGVGDLVRDLGRGRSLDAALESRLGLDADGFETAWLSAWRGRIRQSNEALDAAVQARAQTLAGDVSLSARPVAFLDDDLLAEVTAGSVTAEVLFEAEGDGYRWAGPIVDTLAGEGVRLRYPAGKEDLAAAALTLAEQTLAQFSLRLAQDEALDLGAASDPLVSLDLYDDLRDFRLNVRLDAPASATNWTAPAAPVNWLARDEDDVSENAAALAAALAKQVLWQAGGCEAVNAANCPDWFYEGLAGVVAAETLGAAGRQDMAGKLSGLMRDIDKRRAQSITAFPPLDELSDKDADKVVVQARELLRYFVSEYGWAGVSDLLAALARGQDIDAALRAVTGTDVAGFEEIWQGEILRGFAEDGWVQLAQTFNYTNTLAHVQELASPQYGGRQAGSPGGELAAQYIAEQFAQTNLRPAGDDGSWFQRFPISYTTFSALPAITVIDEAGQPRQALIYRQDFLMPFSDVLVAGTTEAAVVWVRDDYGDIKLGGNIVLRRGSDDIAADIAEAVEHGAGGLLLLSERKGKSLLAKPAIPVGQPMTTTIPVFELTAEGLENLLDAGGHDLGELSASPPSLLLNLVLRLDQPLTPPETVNSANVLALLPGSDPDLAGEVIILGAHYDHVGDDPDGLRYPGGNDNASGVGVLLELARMWSEANYQPKRSILFAAWGAQEAGQVGSTYFVQNPPLPLDTMRAMLQLDAVGGGLGFYLDAQGERAEVPAPLFALEMAAEVVESRLTLNPPAGVSDQEPFRAAGYPALLLTWTDASEANYAAEIADEVQPLRLGQTGRAVSLAVNMLADERLP